jgi:kumamolisin
MTGKTWTPPKRAHYIGPHTSDTPQHVTLVLRRNPYTKVELSNTPVGVGRARFTHAMFGENFGAHQADINAVHDFVDAHGLTHLETAPHRRVVKIAGKPADLAKAFGVEMHCYQSDKDGSTFAVASREPTLPPGVIGVLGLDRRPVAKFYAKMRAPGSLQPGESDNTYTPPQLGEIYAFPANTDGSGQCIGIIELGGGYTQDNLDQYFQSLGMTSPVVEAISVDGGQNQTGTDADGEVQLDIEVAGALAPKAKFAVYFTTNTDQGFYEAISQAAHDATNKPSVISISWGGPEDEWSSQAVQSLQSALEDAAGLGITVTVAAGDNGATDGVNDGQLHCDFPSSSPSVVACGGTMLIAQGTHITQESVWNEDANGEGAGGGGVSVEFGLPTWQANAKVPSNPQGKPGRGVPDVAGVADPVTGYQVLVNGEAQVVGGTSAVAPLWAALIARFNQALGESTGELNSVLYGIPNVESVFHDITSGTNDGYSAHAGWDAATGLGSPNGTAILGVLEGLKAKGQKV